MNRQLFIVKTAKGSNIVSERSLVKDINDAITNSGTVTKIKQTDVTSYAKSLLQEYNGAAIEQDTYENMLNNATIILVKFSSLTPFEFGKYL